MDQRPLFPLPASQQRMASILLPKVPQFLISYASHYYNMILQPFLCRMFVVVYVQRDGGDISIFPFYGQRRHPCVLV